MKNKILLWVGAVAVLAAAFWFFMLRGPAVAPAETLLPKDTVYYCGSRSPLKIRAALAAVDLKGTIQESADLTEEESRIVSDWIGGLQGAHIGFRSFTLVPFVLDATVILEGTFERPLSDLLATDFQKRFQPKESYRDVAFQKALIPVQKTFSLEIYITDPVQNRTFIAFSRRSLTEAVDRMLDGGPSLADNPVYQKMTSLKAIRKADVIQYVDTQAYLRMFYDWVKSIPQPQFKALADLFWNELRLADYGSSVAGGRFDPAVAHSFMRIDPDNPLYRQFQVKSPLVLPYVPANSCQFSFCRLAGPAEAFKQLTDMTVRLKKGIFPVAGNQIMEPVEDFLGQLGLAVGGNPADAGQLLTGELGMWQAVAIDPLKKPSFCFYIGINDAERVKEVIASFRLKVTETDGICTVAGSPAVAWSVQPSGLLIASDPDYLRASLSPGETSLTDTPTFRTLLKKMPRDYSSLKFTTYEQGVSLQTSAALPSAFKGVLDLFKGFSQVSVTRAENGMLTSFSAQQFNPDPQAVRAVLKQLFSAEWSQADSSVQTTPPLDLTADEAYSKSIELLSAGQQIDAEDLVEKAYRQYPEDVRLLFAQAVLERSRWSVAEAQYFFSQISQRFPGTVCAQAAERAMALDRHESVGLNMADLIQLSDDHPDHIYLLWLSAIQCREQAQEENISSEYKSKVATLGRTQYEKLLSKFTVGPVMVHHTYANILTEYFKEYEEAMKHRYIAVAMSPRGWVYQGMANTLTEMKRYDEALVMWGKAVELDPDADNYWRRWGDALYELKRYDEALDKYTKSASLGSSDYFTYYRMALCNRNLKKHDNLFPFFSKGADLGDRYSMYEVGKCYRNGWGCETNLQQAAIWFRKAADAGLAHAQRELGICYSKGEGVAQDWEEAIKWYRAAVEQRDVKALFRLAECYAKGNGVSVDSDEEQECYRKVLEIDPKNRLAQAKLSGGPRGIREVDDSRIESTPRIEKSPELSLRSLAGLASVAASEGRYVEAAEMQKRLIDLGQKKFPGKEIPATLLKRLDEYEQKAAEAGL